MSSSETEKCCNGRTLAVVFAGHSVGGMLAALAALGLSAQHGWRPLMAFVSARTGGRATEARGRGEECRGLQEVVPCASKPG